uniref:Uncharacterized protein n=1 Tax=Ixodes scapularis TaxID=6945 RepID=A0A4D5RG66_IXOSC
MSTVAFSFPFSLYFIFIFWRAVLFLQSVHIKYISTICIILYASVLWRLFTTVLLNKLMVIFKEVVQELLVTCTFTALALTNSIAVLLRK